MDQFMAWMVEKRTRRKHPTTAKLQDSLAKFQLFPGASRIMSFWLKMGWVPGYLD